MFSMLKGAAKKLIHNMGYDVSRYQPPVNDGLSFPHDFTDDDIEICLKVAPFSMATHLGIRATCAAVEYVVKNKRPGAIVECGVWKGGSMMAAAYTLLKLGETSYDLFLFDTFEGMPEPSEVDVTYKGDRASDLLAQASKSDEIWAYSSLEEVKGALYSVGYDNGRIHFVKGRVEDTIPAEAPDTISLLRLDTDFHRSTCHELLHLYPRLSRGGILIVDDYGHWRGARRAVDDYIQENDIQIFLSRIDTSGRIAVKL